MYPVVWHRSGVLPWKTCSCMLLCVQSAAINFVVKKTGQHHTQQFSIVVSSMSPLQVIHFDPAHVTKHTRHNAQHAVVCRPVYVDMGSNGGHQDPCNNFMQKMPSATQKEVVKGKTRSPGISWAFRPSSCNNSLPDGRKTYSRRRSAYPACRLESDALEDPEKRKQSE